MNFKIRYSNFLSKPKETMSTYTLVLVRHGESEWNKTGLFTGWYDCDLSATGVEEAKSAGKALCEDKNSLIVYLGWGWLVCCDYLSGNGHSELLARVSTSSLSHHGSKRGRVVKLSLKGLGEVNPLQHRLVLGPPVRESAKEERKKLT